MLGRRGEFERVADWLPVLPLCDRRTDGRTGKTYRICCGHIINLIVPQLSDALVALQ